jgi:hypothetical protein
MEDAVKKSLELEKRFEELQEQFEEGLKKKA